MSGGVLLLQRYFPELSLEKQEKFILFAELFKSWNERINLVSRKDIDQFYLHHLLHSLVIAKFIDFGKGTKVMDIGTGGGLPGLPLAIYFSETNFYLIDSIRKKTEAVIEKLFIIFYKIGGDIICETQQGELKNIFIITETE